MGWRGGGEVEIGWGGGFARATWVVCGGVVEKRFAVARCGTRYERGRDSQGLGSERAWERGWEGLRERRWEKAGSVAGRNIRGLRRKCLVWAPTYPVMHLTKYGSHQTTRWLQECTPIGYISNILDTVKLYRIESSDYYRVSRLLVHLISHRFSYRSICLRSTPWLRTIHRRCLQPLAIDPKIGSQHLVVLVHFQAISRSAV